MSGMTPAEVLHQLVTLFPGFRPYWEAEDSFRSDDGTFTFCGVFATYTWYFKESFRDLSAASLHALGEFLEECMADPNDELDTAAATCFLENLAGEPPARVLQPFLAGNALQYLEQLDVGGGETPEGA